RLPRGLAAGVLVRGQCRHGHFRGGRLDGFEERARHRRIDAIPADELAGTSALLLVHLGAFVAGRRAVARVAHTHPPPTPATQDEPLQQRGARADGPAPVVCPRRAVVVEALLVAEELLPGEAARVGVVPHNRPGRQATPSSAPLDAWRLVRQGAGARLRAAVNEDTRVTRVVQDVQDTAVPQRLPEQLPVAGLAPEALGEEQAMLGEVLDDGPSGARLLEEGEEQADSLLHLFIRVEDQSAGLVEDA